MCSELLRTHGFSVTEEPFTFSAFPGRWGTPLIGALWAATLMVASRLGWAGRAAAALAALAGGAVVLGVTARWLASHGVLAMGWMRRSSVNLVATRDGPLPNVWLVAHLDSKSQPVPILARAAGITLSGLIAVAAAIVAAVQWRGAAVGPWWVWVAALGLIAAVPVVASTVGNRSPGALDNASGVATVLLAVESLPPSTRIGVLLSSAEELGLAGARAFAERGLVATAINCDGVDDSGAMRCMYSGAPPKPTLYAVRRAASRLRIPMHVSRLIPGVLTDGVALADAGWAAVTLSRGSLATLARIHTTRDVATALEGSGISDAARLIVTILEEIG
jgi:hypothetical protein